MAASAKSSSVSIGFIGCGTIASAVVSGLAKGQQANNNGNNGSNGNNGNTKMPTISTISLSKRSEKKSTALKEEFPDLVTVHSDNQEILDRSDIIFLCVLNDQTATVLGPLKFDGKRHTLISMVATSKLDMLQEFSKLGSERVFKMICLPSVAKQEGCALIVPKSGQKDRDNNPNISTIHIMLETLGGFVECETEELMNVMITPTCLMGPLYGILRQNQEWLVQKGVPAKDATYFVGRQYWSMMQDAERGCHEEADRFEKLVEEQTPKGLNEQALGNIKELGVLDSYSTAMDAVLSRLKGDSDGSLAPPTKKTKTTDN